jgi:hypothetical protein
MYMTLLETQARDLIEERTTHERREPCGVRRHHGRGRSFGGRSFGGRSFGGRS